MRKIKVKPYARLALVYDHLMNHVNYELWVKYISGICRNYIGKDAKVLELACGNGRFSQLFRKYYPDIIISDKSLEMLSSAKTEIPRVCCEMGRLPFKKQFDLIFSTFDSVNYLLKKKDVLNLFKEIKTILSDKGIFTFDVCLEKNSLTYIETPERSGITDGIIYYHKSIYNKRTRLHSNEFDIKFSDGAVYREVHRQKIYPFELYFELIEKSGLFVAECFNTFTFKKAGPDSRRVQFIVKKIPDAIIQ